MENEEFFPAKNARIIVAKTTTFLCYALDKKRVELCRDTNCGQILNEWLIPPRKLEQILPEGETGKGGPTENVEKFQIGAFVEDLDWTTTSVPTSLVEAGHGSEEIKYAGSENHQI